MLKKITIDNFKSIKHLDYECAGLNLLVGLNGAGKSSFVQMLRILQAASKEDIGKPQLDVGPVGSKSDAAFDDLLYGYSKGPSSISFDVEFSLSDDDRDYRLSRVLRRSPWVNVRPGTLSLERPEWQKTWQTSQCKVILLESKMDAGKDVSSEEIKAAEACADKILAEAEDMWMKEDKDASKCIKKLFAASRFVDAFRKKPCEVHQGGSYGAGQLCWGDSSDIDVFDPEGGDVMEFLHGFGFDNELLSRVNKCLEWVSPGAKLEIQEDKAGGETYYVAALDYGVDEDHRRFKPQNVGFGVSYILPVLVTLLSAKAGNIVIVENPEAHLHPRGQSEIGKLIAQTVARGVQVFVETHSDHVINGIRVAVKKGVVKPSDVNIAFFERGPHDVVQEDGTINHEIYAEVTNIKVDATGSLSEWPKGFMDEWGIQQMKLLRP